MSTDQFQQTVIADLAELKTKVNMLCEGPDGQSGLPRRVAKLEGLRNKALGIIGLITILMPLIAALTAAALSKK